MKQHLQIYQKFYLSVDHPRLCFLFPVMKMRKFQIGSYRVIQKLQMLDRRQGGFGNQMKNNQFEFFYLIYKKTDQTEKLLDTFH